MHARYKSTLLTPEAIPLPVATKTNRQRPYVIEKRIIGVQLETTTMASVRQLVLFLALLAVALPTLGAKRGKGMRASPRRGGGGNKVRGLVLNSWSFFLKVD